jgi:hypothetical protein
MIYKIVLPGQSGRTGKSVRRSIFVNGNVEWQSIDDGYGNEAGAILAAAPETVTCASMPGQVETWIPMRRHRGF